MKEDGTPSFTSLIVARYILLLGSDEYGCNKLPSNCYADIQLQLLNSMNVFTGIQYWLHIIFLITSRWIPFFGKITRWYTNTIMAPGYVEAFGDRKCYMEKQVRDALEEPTLTDKSSQRTTTTAPATDSTATRDGDDDDEDGDNECNENNKKNNKNKMNQIQQCQQVVVVGAGYDTLAYRLSKEYPNVQFYEIDHPSTGRVKLNGLKKMSKQISAENTNKMNNNIPSNMHTIHADPTKTKLSDVLMSTDNTYDSKLPTAYVIEGLLYYLKEDDVIDLFHQISNVSYVGTRVIFDFFQWDHVGQCPKMSKNYSHYINNYILKYKHEQMYWGISIEDIEKTFFKHTSWNVIHKPISSSIENFVTIELH